ncbi:MAG TPA: GNAT family protein [Nitrospira sp.]|nr:GNAT family protein [Nitrospira sp.]
MIRGIASPFGAQDTPAASSVFWPLSPSRLWNAGRNRLWYCRELRVYRYPLDNAPPLPFPSMFRRNCLEDLRYYQRAAKEQRPPDEYRKIAAERRAQGFQLYTYVESERLLHYAWLIERQTRGEDGWVDQVYFPPPGTAVLFDHFTHPLARGRGLYYQALCRLLHDARNVARARQAFVTVFGSNAPSRHVIEKVGFQHEASLFKERWFIWSKRYAVNTGGVLPTSLL